MDLKGWQKEVDKWIKTHGVRYFDVKTNGLILMEEVGELARHLARLHGEQSYKNSEDLQSAQHHIEEEMSDVLFVLMCLANQMDIDLSKSLQASLDKKTRRDSTRHQSNHQLRRPDLSD